MGLAWLAYLTHHAHHAQQQDDPGKECTGGAEGLGRTSGGEVLCADAQRSPLDLHLRKPKVQRQDLAPCLDASLLRAQPGCAPHGPRQSRGC
eukprot:1085841-Pelagomonas_calceolata.AAC.1